MDSYGLSKVCNEKTARAFAMRYKADIYALAHRQRDRAARIRTRSRAFAANPPMRKRNAWSYIDARDLGEIVRLCLEKDGLGFQVFNATNDTITAQRADRRGTGAALSQYAGDPADGRVRGAVVEPQDPRSARLQGGPQLANTRGRLNCAPAGGRIRWRIVRRRKLRHQQNQRFPPPRTPAERKEFSGPWFDLPVMTAIYSRDRLY